jgi:hypothetical protein
MLSFVSASASGQASRVAATVRATYLEPVTRLVGDPVPYAFQDVYLKTRVPMPGGRPMVVTAFGSRDAFGYLGRTKWSSVLLGQRWRVLERPGAAVDLAASASRYALDGTEVQVRNSSVNIHNEFERVQGSAALVLSGGSSSGAIGLTLGSRGTRSDMVVTQGRETPPQVPPTQQAEVQAYAKARRTWDRASLDLGLRLDATGRAARLQPRATLLIQASEGTTFGFGVIRAARLYQHIADPQPEPDVTFYDFWLPAGTSGIPIPEVTHLTADADIQRDRLGLHAAAYASRGDGLAELRPAWDRLAASNPFRFGRSRTFGIELRGSWRTTDRRSGVAASYAWSRSDREWDETGWVPWRLDRRHTVRLQGERRVGAHWSFSGFLEAQSGQASTPVVEVYKTYLTGDTVPGYLYWYYYGAEGSARSRGTVRADLAVNLRTAGPFGSRMLIGLSVVNAGFGPVAPDVPYPEPTSPPFIDIETGVRYRRAFSIPAVPSLLIRLEF